MQEEALPVKPDELWIPGRELEPPSVHPTLEEFRLRFVNAVWGGKGEPSTVNFVDCLSALRVPDKQPVAAAFVDLDEVLGNLGHSLHLLQHQPNGKQFFTHDYGVKGIFNDSDPIKQALMGLVKNEAQPGIGQQAVEHLEVIASMHRSWRDAGVYVTCITSPVNGAALSSLDFMGRHLKGAFDAIVATTSDYMMADKGQAAARVVDFIDLPPGAPAIHIDDIPHNTTRVRAALGVHPKNLRVATFQHVFDHPSHMGVDSGSTHGATPIETFLHANDYLTEQLADQRAGRPLFIPLSSLVQLR